MLEALERIAQKLEVLKTRSAEPDLVKKQAEYVKTIREIRELEPVVEAYGRYRECLHRIEESRKLLVDPASEPDLKHMAEEDMLAEEANKVRLEEEIKGLLLPVDPNDDKSVIVEIRAGTGGDEASLFAADLYRMYERYAAKQGFKIEPIEFAETGLKGFKEMIFQVSGKGAYGKLKYEKGVHRVQRVPATEANGRIHTSAVTVAVLPEVEETEVEIKESDLRIDTYRASGAGGQHVNKTDSAVRITHIPTGTVVACQDERSQIKNRSKAMKLLRARIADNQREKEAKELAADRKQQVGSGDRSERNRTYNFPQNRVTEHRINLTLHQLDRFMEGEMSEIIEALRLDEKQALLAEMKLGS